MLLVSEIPEANGAFFGIVDNSEEAIVLYLRKLSSRFKNISCHCKVR